MNAAARSSTLLAIVAYQAVVNMACDGELKTSNESVRLLGHGGCHIEEKVGSSALPWLTCSAELDRAA